MHTACHGTHFGRAAAAYDVLTGSQSTRFGTRGLLRCRCGRVGSGHVGSGARLRDPGDWSGLACSSFSTKKRTGDTGEEVTTEGTMKGEDERMEGGKEGGRAE